MYEDLLNISQQKDGALFKTGSPTRSADLVTPKPVQLGLAEAKRGRSGMRPIAEEVLLWDSAIREHTDLLGARLERRGPHNNPSVRLTAGA